MDYTQLPPLLTVQQAADLLGLTRKTLYRMVKRGSFRPAEVSYASGKTKRPAIRIHREGIRRILESCHPQQAVGMRPQERRLRRRDVCRQEAAETLKLLDRI